MQFIKNLTKFILHFEQFYHLSTLIRIKSQEPGAKIFLL